MLDNRSAQRGNYLMTMSIMLLLGSMIALGSAKVASSNMQAAKGRAIGNQLQVVNTALTSYIAKNSGAIVAGTAVSGVANVLSPTIAELKTLNLLSSGFSITPTAGDSYNTTITASPNGCTTNCQPVGAVWLTAPIRGAGNLTTDINLLGAAMRASTSGQIGFSTPSSPNVISGAGWTVPNPDPSVQAGILLATTEFKASLQATQYWLQSVANASSLPALDNTLGDGRLARDTNKPYSWNGTAWGELFSNPVTGSVSVGDRSGSPNNAASNSFFGNSAGASNITGSLNVAVGSEVLRSNTAAHWNVAVGAQALYSNITGGDNVAVGSIALANNITGGSNVAVGSGALYGNTSGRENMAAGTVAMHNNTTGYNNVALGMFAMYYNTTGDRNVAIGHYAGPTSGSLSNTIALGSGATVANSNTIQLGNSQVTNVNTSGTVSANGIILTSDRRLKANIRHSSFGLAFINKLNPVQYNFTSSPTIPQTGFIAQEVEAADATFSAVKKPATDSDFYGLSYTDFIPPIVNAIQEMDAKLEQIPAQKESRNQKRIDQLSTACACLFALLTFSIVFSIFIFKRLGNLQRQVDALVNHSGLKPVRLRD